MKKGFTLIEMLIVIGIIAVLAAASMSGYSRVVANAEKVKCQELVANTATALTALFQKEGVWPKKLIAKHNTDVGLDQIAALPLATGGYMSLTVNSEGTELSGYDKYGIISPWAVDVMKAKGSTATESTRVPAGGTIADHRLRYALDLDGDGIIESVNIGGETIDIRATAVVWSAGKDGKLETYSRGQKKDDVYSWTVGQTKNVR